MSTQPVTHLEKTIAITFLNKDLLTSALTHRSYLNEHPEFPFPHNERLEFLGDAVLELVVTESLYLHYPNPEGELTNWRASLVNANMLSELAKEINLDAHMKLSRGEAKESNTKARQYILANAYEALIGAIYLDQGWNAAKRFIEEQVLVKLPYILEHQLYVDPKSRFQEMAQEVAGVTPIYRVLEESGPDHERHFKIGVYLNDEFVADGEGSSKQEAQMAAAEKGLEVKEWK
ncbi:MAG: ribonuclease III [Patescibacteria group bacterium]